MPQQQSPFLEGKYGWNFGEAGWNTGMDENLLKFSFMFDRNVDGVVSSLPAVINGQAYFLTTDNRLYFAVGTTWYSSPTPKWFEFKIRTTGDVYQFNGTSAVQVESLTGLDSRLDAIELTLSTLGTAAFEDVEFFATQAELDVAEAASQQYTDAAVYVRQISDVNSLRSPGNEGRFANDRVQLLGYYSTSPGKGGGELWWDSLSTEADNGGTIFAVSGVTVGRWKRPYNGSAWVEQFGAKGDGVTDDTAAIQAAHNIATIREVRYGPGIFLISLPIEVINNGQKIIGIGGQRFSANRTTVRQTVAGAVAFQQQASTNWAQEDGFSMYDMEIHSDKGIQINPLDRPILDGMSATFPYIMRPEFRRLTLRPLTTGLAGNFGIAMAKVFDHIIEQCDINGQTRGIVMSACDIGRVSTNRITNFHEYGILELSSSNGGSQNLILNNDMVRCSSGTGTFFRSTNRHVRFIDNYLEQPDGSCAGFVDLTWQSGLDYPNNTSAGMYGTVEVSRNRIDGHAKATSFIYRYDPTQAAQFGYSVNIEDTGTSGDSATLPWLSVVGSVLPIRVGPQGFKRYRLSGGYNTSSANRFTAFETRPLEFGNGQVVITAENLVNMNRGELNRNNAADHVGLSDGGFVIRTTLGATALHVVLPSVGGVINPYLRNGETIPVKVVARCASGTQNLNILKVVNAAPQGVTTSTLLDTQFQTISFNFTGVASTSTVGLALSFGATQSSDIIIQSITFG